MYEVWEGPNEEENYNWGLGTLETRIRKFGKIWEVSCQHLSATWFGLLSLWSSPCAPQSTWWRKMDDSQTPRLTGRYVQVHPRGKLDLLSVPFTRCYGLNVGVPPNLNPQCDRIWRWGSWEHIRSQEWSPWEISALTRRDANAWLLSLLLPYEDSPLETKKRGLTRSSRSLIWDFPASRTETNVCCWSPPAYGILSEQAALGHHTIVSVDLMPNPVPISCDQGIESPWKNLGTLNPSWLLAQGPSVPTRNFAHHNQVAKQLALNSYKLWLSFY